MVKKLVIVCALVLAGLIAGVAPVAAAPTTSERYGITVRLPKSVKAFNGNKAVVSPTIRLRSGVQRKVFAHVTRAYAGKRRVASGRSVRLKPGKYSVRVTVTFRNWAYVSRSRTVRTWHDGGMPDGSQCTVTAVYDWDQDGVGDAVAAADCTNDAYPRQVVHATDLTTNDSASSYSVGDVVASDYVEFDGYYSTSIKHYRVRQWRGGYVHWTTPARKVAVINGGHRRSWNGNDTYTTPYTSVPKGAHIYYDYVSEGDGTCYFGLDAEYSGGVQSLRDQWRYSGSGRFVTKQAMRVRFDVFSSCDWHLELTWH